MHYFIKNIYLFLFSKEGPLFVVSWERDGETYTQRGDFFLYHIFFRGRWVPTLAPPVKPYHQRRSNSLIGCVSLARLPILCTLSKSDHVVITWSPYSFTPVGPACTDMLPSPCLLIIKWQLFKSHGVIRNKPKIHFICYETDVLRILKSSSITRASSLYCLMS